MLPGVVGEESDDGKSGNACRASEDTDEGGDAVYLANDLALFFFFVTLCAVEEELVFFVTRDLSTISKEEQEADGDHCPDNEHGR